MKCPKCGLEQPNGRPDCQACGIIFAKWHGGGPPRQHAVEPPPLPAGPPDVYEPPPEPTGPAPSARGGGVFGGVVLLAVAGLAAWWLNLSAGRSVPESAYRDPQGRFALSPPPGWMTLSSANFQQVMAEIKDRFPPAMRELMKADRVAVAFFLLGGQDQFAPSLNVVVVDRPSDVRRLGEPERQQLTDAISRQFAQIIPGYRLDSSRLQKVDGLDAIHILGYADLFMPGMANPRGGLRVEQVMVLGTSHAFILSCTVEASVLEQAPNCEAMVNSFRVLGTRFGPVVKGGMNGALVGMALYALKMIFGS